MNPATGRLTEFRHFEIGDEDLIAAACAVNTQAGASVYIRACTVSTAPGAYTTDDNFVQAPGAWGDLDTTEQMERARNVASMIRPNAFVTTGLTPHMRCQTFFRTSDPIPDAALVRQLNQRVHALYGGDSAVVNPTRLMRLPGTIAWPWKAGRVPELTTFSPPTDGRVPAYPVSALTSQLPRIEAPDTSAVPFAPDKSGRRATLSTSGELIRLIQGGREWHNNMVRLTAHWIGRGWSNHEILTAAEAFTLPGFTHAQTVREVRKALDGARGKWGVPDVDHTVHEGPAAPFSDKVVDPWDDLTAPAFPLQALPDVLQRFAETRARAMGADPCALAWAALSACSAALHGGARLNMKRHEPWSVPPAIWVALIGRSSTKKSPIISSAWGPLERLQAGDLENWARQKKIHDAMSKAEKAEASEPPPPRRLVSHDLTMESLQGILSHQGRGIGVLRDELSGFIGSLDRYSARGTGAERAFFLQAYNGVSHVVDRVGRGTVVIQNLLVAICGGIQPDKLAQFTDLTDDGLWQRFIPIIVAAAEMGEDVPAGSEIEAYDRLIARLVSVDGHTRASFAEGAHDVRESFEKEVWGLEQRAPMGDRFASFTGKLPGLFGRLCLVLSHVEPGLSPFIVSERTAQAVRMLILRCVVPHAAQVYWTMGGDGGGIETTRAIAGYILTKKLSRLVISDLTRNVRQCRNMTVADVGLMVSRLTASGWLAPEKDSRDNNAWLVNPVVHEMFSERAARETRRRAESHILLRGEPEDA